MSFKLWLEVQIWHSPYKAKGILFYEVALKKAVPKTRDSFNFLFTDRRLGS